jgi:predicted glycosyltransferase
MDAHVGHSEAAIRPVLVSAGGGQSGDTLVYLRAAVRSRPLCPASISGDTPWYVFVGWCVEETLFQQCVDELNNPPSVVVRRASKDFIGLLARCKMSISQGGYNTTMEVVSSGRPAVIVPVCYGNDVEQAVRAHKMAQISRLRVACVDYDEVGHEWTVLPVSPERIAAAARATLGDKRIYAETVRTDGGRVTAQWVVDLDAQQR